MELIGSHVHCSPSQVAIKKIGDIFANPLDARRTLREIQVCPCFLRALRFAEHLVCCVLDSWPVVVHTHAA